MEFEMLLQLIARHDGRKPSLTGIVTFDTPSRYEREEYLTLVDVDETVQ